MAAHTISFAIALKDQGFVEGAKNATAAIGNLRDQYSKFASETSKRLNPHLFPIQSAIEAAGVSTGRVPPILSTLAATGTNWRQALLGAGAGVFSPWIGARLLNSSGLFGGGGGAGGGGGLLGGGAGGFAAAFIALKVVTESLRIAFEQLKEAVKRGSELYVKSAELGLNVGVFSHLQKTLTAVGLPNAAERLSAFAQFAPRGFRATAPELGNALLGASRGILSREELQGILNLSGDIADAWNRTQIASLASGISAYQLFRTQLDFTVLKTNWNSLMEELAAIFSRHIRPVLRLTEAWLGAIEVFFALRLRSLGLASKTGADFQKFGGIGSATARPESGWEKMGLIINGGIGGTDYARQTAINTKAIADLLRRGAPDQNPNSTAPSIAAHHLS